ncbi:MULTISPECIES: hypothetical protein [Clostridia]|uniref:YqeB family protein n=1 Tax=Clostridia TaxID=186801 RepID=UPI000EA1D44E|nr:MULTISPECIES: hypothetical protein [Clostridia]NBJ70166.1 hypothetical protein [Roseburia sp. 1XD42-34]RKI77123.1 hypothetical protein D7V87_11860 [Clostridium sp. 1xD42-85]
MKSVLLGPTKSTKFMITIVLIGLGIILGYFAIAIVEWIINIDFLPFQDELQFIHKIIEKLNDLFASRAALFLALIGGIIGLIVAMRINKRLLVISVTKDYIDFKKGANISQILASNVNGIFVEEDELVVLDEKGNELFRNPLYTSNNLLKSTLLDYGYPWFDKDPYLFEYQEWLLSDTNLPSYIHTLLKVRRHALELGNDEEADMIREELKHLGIILRDKDEKQYWRGVIKEEDQ